MTTAQILGQIGLAMSAISCIGIVHTRALAEERPGAYYYVGVWILSVMCAVMFSHPYKYGTIYPFVVPNMVYYTFLALGIERFVVFLNYKLDNPGQRIGAELILRVNNAIGVMVALGIATVFGWAMYNRVEQNGEETRKLRAELRQNQKATVATDTAKLGDMQRTIDLLSRKLSRSEQTVASLTGQLAKANDRLGKLTREIAKLGVSVERTRTSAIQVTPAPLQPSGHGNLIPADKVKAPEPSNFKKKP